MPSHRRVTGARRRPVPSRCPRGIQGGQVRFATAAVLVVAVILLGSPAGATWSIVTTDPETGSAGVALASCVPADVLGDPLGPLVPVIVAPGPTAAVVQGQFNPEAPGRIRELAEVNAGADEVLADIARAEDDPRITTRQYAMVDGQGDAAAFSGDELSSVAGDRQGTSVTVQGNLLVSDEVLDATLTAFETSRSGGDTLVQSLTQGLLAGSRAGGDRRCDDQTALFAQVVVSEGSESGAPTRVVTVVVDLDDGQNPVELLAQAVDQGRFGLIDAGTSDDGGGVVVQIIAGVAGVAMAALGVFAFRKGIGSTAARKAGR